MGIFILFQTFDTDQYLSQLTKKASFALGRPVSIGHVGLGLSPQAGITLDVGPVIIMDDPAFTTQPFIKVDRVRIGLDLGSLIFRREIRVTSIGLQSPQVHFIRSLEGEINIRSIVMAGHFSDDINKPNDGTVPGKDLDVITSPRSTHEAKLKGIGQFKVQDAALSLIDQNRSFPLDIWLTGIDAHGGDLLSPEPFSATFIASLYSDTPNVHVAASISFDQTKRSLKVRDLKLDLDLSKLDLDRLKGVSPGIQNSPIFKDITGVLQLNLSQLEVGPSGSFTANGDMNITNGVIKDFNIIKVILSHSLGAFSGFGDNITELLNGKFKDKLGADDTFIEKAEAQFSIHDKTMFIEDLIIQTNIFEMTAKGSVDQGLNLDMQTMLHLNTDVSASLVNELDGLKFLCDGSKRIAIGASLEGIIPHLKYKPNKDFKKKSRKALIEEGGNLLGVLFGGGKQ